MKVALPTVSVSDEYRRIVAWYQERPSGDPRKCRLADRQEVRDWIIAYGQNLDADAAYEMDLAIEEFEAEH